MTAISLLKSTDSYRASYNQVEAEVQTLENDFLVFRDKVKAWQEGEMDYLDQDRTTIRTQLDKVYEVFMKFKAQWTLEEVFEDAIDCDNESYKWDRIRDRIIDLKKDFAVIDLVPSEAAPQIRERDAHKKIVIIALCLTIAIIAGAVIFLIIQEGH